MSVGGTDCKILEPFPFSRKWFSRKFNGPGLRHEVALCISTGRIAWAHGPFPCGPNTDLVIFREGLKKALSPSEMVIGGKGYCDAKFFTDSEDCNVSEVDFRRIRARHEAVNRRLKQFFVLSHAFRHDLRRHSACFHAALNLIQLMIDNGAPLFKA